MMRNVAILATLSASPCLQAFVLRRPQSATTSKVVATTPATTGLRAYPEPASKRNNGIPVPQKQRPNTDITEEMLEDMARQMKDMNEQMEEWSNMYPRDPKQQRQQSSSYVFAGKKDYKVQSWYNAPEEPKDPSKHMDLSGSGAVTPTTTRTTSSKDDTTTTSSAAMTKWPMVPPPTTKDDDDDVAGTMAKNVDNVLFIPNASFDDHNNHQQQDFIIDDATFLLQDIDEAEFAKMSEAAQTKSSVARYLHQGDDDVPTIGRDDTDDQPIIADDIDQAAAFDIPPFFETASAAADQQTVALVPNDGDDTMPILDAKLAAADDDKVGSTFRQDVPLNDQFFTGVAWEYDLKPPGNDGTASEQVAFNEDAPLSDEFVTGVAYDYDLKLKRAGDDEDATKNSFKEDVPLSDEFLTGVAYDYDLKFPRPDDDATKSSFKEDVPLNEEFFTGAEYDYDLKLPRPDDDEDATKSSFKEDVPLNDEFFTGAAYDYDLKLPLLEEENDANQSSFKEDVPLNDEFFTGAAYDYDLNLSRRDLEEEDSTKTFKEDAPMSDGFFTGAAWNDDQEQGRVVVDPKRPYDFQINEMMAVVPDNDEELVFIPEDEPSSSDDLVQAYDWKLGLADDDHRPLPPLVAVQDIVAAAVAVEAVDENEQQKVLHERLDMAQTTIQKLTAEKKQLELLQRQHEIRIDQLTMKMALQDEMMVQERKGAKHELDTVKTQGQAAIQAVTIALERKLAEATSVLEAKLGAAQAVVNRLELALQGAAKEQEAAAQILQLQQQQQQQQEAVEVAVESSATVVPQVGGGDDQPDGSIHGDVEFSTTTTAPLPSIVHRVPQAERMGMRRTIKNTFGAMKGVIATAFKRNNEHHKRSAAANPANVIGNSEMVQASTMTATGKGASVVVAVTDAVEASDSDIVAAAFETMTNNDDDDETANDYEPRRLAP